MACWDPQKKKKRCRLLQRINHLSLSLCIAHTLDHTGLCVRRVTSGILVGCIRAATTSRVFP